MTVDQALDHPGELLAVWDHSGANHALLVYSSGDGKLELLAVERMGAMQREAKTTSLRRRGIRIGATDGASPFIWSKDGGFTVWTLTSVVADGRDDTLKTTAGGVVRRADVASVVSFLAVDSLGHRGVKAVTRSGVEIVIAEEDSAAAKLDPTYGMDNVMIDAAWATFLGRDLAAWLNVPHTDELP